MATYALIHGAGDSSFHWHLLVPELRGRGHEVVAVDLPCEDESAELGDYAEAAAAAIGSRGPVTVVAQSLGGFTAPLLCDRVPVELIVLIAGMVPLPGELGKDWPANTGYPGPNGTTEIEIFFDDVPAERAKAAIERSRRQADGIGEEPWPLAAWPQVPTRYLLCTRDRMFPAEWMREVVRERLGIEPDEIDSGHCPALSRPRELAGRLEAYRRELGLQ
ncbi:alpha/beta hydrolase [Conexibacter stalactiti]|uniref:Alpha/beta hydrolase n=1 Tax=Conexibacter stalactiti TaxID=1940611 RepID=A0ABU4HUP6_9ACTN|nr:alpha/beta hydrolase [Conexibacter stalactiti]MDW5596407.1 alpha/beta hydrolase [Conexibacter stalactiti]MEC5037049.1 alpha/beta hydrolase [Conexibacter stalactiti]